MKQDSNGFYLKEIVTRTEKISLDDSGIVLCIALKDSYLHLEDAIENVEAVKMLAGGRRVPVLVDISQAKGASKESRDYFGSKKCFEVQSACALLVGSSLSELIGNFFLGLNKPLFPLEVFTEKEEALSWLKQQQR
ncbi:hypothetical protein GCM10028791_38560 [Echinicola sediminis]